jgi:hypothetical protein
MPRYFLKFTSKLTKFQNFLLFSVYVYKSKSFWSYEQCTNCNCGEGNGWNYMYQECIACPAIGTFLYAGMLIFYLFLSFLSNQYISIIEGYVYPEGCPQQTFT